MIPEEITQLLQEIRLIGGGLDKYESPDNWQLLRKLVGDRMQVDLMDATPENWRSIRQALEQEKHTVQQQMDQRYFKGVNDYNPFD